MTPTDHYRRDAILPDETPADVTLSGARLGDFISPTPPDEVTMKREDVRQFNRDINAKADAQDKQEAAQSAAMDRLLEFLVLLAMLAAVSAGCWYFGKQALHRMQAEIAQPAVEIDLDAPPVPGGNWEAYDLRKLPPIGSKP